jgi:hypothetical protein
MVDPRLLRDLAETLFASDERGRLQGEAPQLHLLRTEDLVICRCHAELPDALADRLAGLAARPRGRPSEWADAYGDYVGVLTPAGAVKTIRAGLLFAIADPLTEGEVVAITSANVDLLREGLDEWVPDVAAGLPMIAAVAGGRAVSICTSVRASAMVHCAGVETLPDHRGQGLAGRVAAGWARAVRLAGAIPIYGTTFDNLASLGVAWRLGLRPIASEFSIDCHR